MKAKVFLNQPLTQDRYGLHFTRGEAQTDNEYLIKKLQAKGVKVEVIKEEIMENKEIKKEKTLKEMKVDELKEIATEKGIEFKENIKKIDIIKLINNYKDDSEEEKIENKDDIKGECKEETEE